MKDNDGEVEGCHASEADADRQLAALYASEEEAVADTQQLGGKPNPGTDPDKRLKKNKKTSAEGDGEVLVLDPEEPDVPDVPDGEGEEGDGQTEPNALVTETVVEFLVKDIDTIDAPPGSWEGVLAVEGITTGDGREFAPDSLRWADMPLPLTYQPPSHGGVSTDGVLVGRIDEVWRDGSMIRGRGMFDLGNMEAADIHRQVQEGFLKGVSVDVDDVGANVELVWPEDEGEPADGENDGDIISILFATPEKMVYHDGRVRGAAICTIPAFVEAQIWLADSPDAADREASALVAGAAFAAAHGSVPVHDTATSDEPWDRALTENRLGGVDADRMRQAYAWVRPDGHDGRLLHHEVAEDGTVGAANLTACASVVGALQSGADVPDDERRAVYRHVASHLRAAGQEPPPLVDEAMVAHAVGELDSLPPVEWFKDPGLAVPIGITVNDKGRIYGHAAQWGECHIGYADLCVTPPHEDDHPYFMTGEVVCADGGRVAVGQITLGTNHAPLHLGASNAHDHYDNTGVVVADVAVGNDVHGIWVAGAVRPDAPEAKVRELRASGQVSGDWRRIGGQLRLVGLLAVNVPGFPVPRLRARVASGQAVSLVAAGKPTVSRPEVVDAEATRRALRVAADRVAQSVGLDRPEVVQRRLLAARVHGGG